MEPSRYTKPGFSNIRDVPLPKAANMDINKSMVMGSGDTWTGHLVYETDKPQVEVIDFTTSQMQGVGWMKLSELRGKETVITFIKGQRVATVRVTTDKGYIRDQTAVSIDMSNSNLNHTVEHDQSEQTTT